jgi:hypothetical protein
MLSKIINTKIKEFKIWIKKERNVYILIGIFFLIMQFFVFLGNYMSERYDVFFWFCNHTPLFFAFAFFLKKKNIIKGLINIGFLGQFVWSLDFLGKIFFDVHVFKMTAYVFEADNGLWVLLPIAIHMFATNIAFFFTRKKKPNVYTLFYSLIYILFLYAATLTYTLIERNVNCVQLLCGVTDLTFNGYTYFWPLLVFFLIAIPTQGIQYLVYKYCTRK